MGSPDRECLTVTTNIEAEAATREENDAALIAALDETSLSESAMFCGHVGAFLEGADTAVPPSVKFSGSQLRP
jgi:hypothetical protein